MSLGTHPRSLLKVQLSLSFKCIYMIRIQMTAQEQLRVVSSVHPSFINIYSQGTDLV